MPPTPATLRASVLTLRVELLHIEPLIWRRLQVRGAMSLAGLHSTLQIAFGWTNSHLHSFRFAGAEYTNAREELDELKMLPVRGQTLASVLGATEQEFHYLYDWGDGWDHRVVIEHIGKPREGWSYPLCTGGAHACPPEDVGGTGGYEEFLEAIRHPRHEEHERYLIWAGGVFDPEGFDVNSVNRALWKLRR